MNAEGALRAVRVLDKLLLGAKELQVRIGNIQHPLVLAYRNEMKSRVGPDAEEDEVDEATNDEDQGIASNIVTLLKEYEPELNKPLPGNVWRLDFPNKKFRWKIGQSLILLFLFFSFAEDNLSKLKKKSDKDAVRYRSIIFLVQTNIVLCFEASPFVWWKVLQLLWKIYGRKWIFTFLSIIHRYAWCIRSFRYDCCLSSYTNIVLVVLVTVVDRRDRNGGGEASADQSGDSKFSGNLQGKTTECVDFACHCSLTLYFAVCSYGGEEKSLRKWVCVRNGLCLQIAFLLRARLMRTQDDFAV